MAKHVKLFRTPFERINLFFPVAMLSISIVEICLGTRFLWSYSEPLKYIQDVLFFNGLHVGFTYLILGATAAGRDAARNFFSIAGGWGLARLAFVFVGSAASFLMFRTLSGSALGWQFLMVTIFTFSRRHHDLAQSKGLMTIGNRQIGRLPLTANEQTRLLMLTKIETRLLKVFYWTSSLSILSFFDMGALKGPVLGPVANFVFHACFVVAFLAALGMTVCAWMTPQDSGRWKTVFSLRYFMKLISPYSAITAYAGASVHGVEYFCVTDKIIEVDRKKRDVTNRLSRILFAVSFVAVLLLYVVLRYPTVYAPMLTETSSGVADFMTSLAIGFTFSHYFLDHLLFTPRYSFAQPLLRSLSEENAPTSVAVQLHVLEKGSNLEVVSHPPAPRASGIRD